MSDPNLKDRVTHLQIHTKSTLNFINIYAPSVDGKKKPFYRSLNKYLANFNNNYTILMGDFNYVSNRSDRLNKLRACDSYIRNIFKPKEFSLEDSYKHFHSQYMLQMLALTTIHRRHKAHRSQNLTDKRTHTLKRFLKVQPKDVIHR